MNKHFILQIRREPQNINFLQQINSSILERCLLKSSQKILIAVSGGQDSICLLQVLYQLKTKWEWNLGIVHCDHGWHWTSKLQSQHVNRLALSMEINYYQSIAIEPITEEVSARKWRYHIIEIIAMLHNYSTIITAHTASDRIETFIYNLIRGSGLKGLQSLSWKRKITARRFFNLFINQNKEKTKKDIQINYKKSISGISKQTNIRTIFLIRPFLDITRTKTRQFIETSKLYCWPDPTNQNFQISRNRIRNRLIPYIRKHYNPQIEQSLAKLVEIVHAENLYIEQLINNIFLKIRKTIKLNNKKIEGINLSLFHTFPIAIQRRLLLKFAKTKINQNLNFQQIEEIRLFCILKKTSIKERKNQPKKHFFSFEYLILPDKKKLQIIKEFIFVL